MKQRILCLVLAVAAAPIAVAGGNPAAASDGVSTSDAAVSSAPSKVPSLLREVGDSVASALRSNGSASLSASQVGELAQGVFSIDQRGAIEVEIHSAQPVSAAQSAELQALGATVLGSSSDWAPVPGMTLPATGIVDAMVPYDALDDLAASPWVTVLRPAVRPAFDSSTEPVGGTGPIVAESVPLHSADVAQQRGLTGAGQKVGAISGDVDNLAYAIEQGELPDDVQVLRRGRYTDDEGTAMLEIVHDMAPGAELAYASTQNSIYDYIGAFHDLAAAGSTLITEDIAWDDEPAFQQGIGASTAEALGKYGVWVSSSAGNLGTRHAPRVQARGTGDGPDGESGGFQDCAQKPDNVVALRGDDTTFDLSLAPNAQFLTTLQWSEPRAIYPTEGQGGFTDLNLYLMDAAGTTCLKSSRDVQADGVGDTIEQMLYTNRTGATQAVKLVVDVQGRSSAVKAPILDLRWRAYTAGVSAVDPTERAGSLNPDSNYLKFATSAGAVNASTSVDPATIALEAYSAAGPVQIVSTTKCPGRGPGPCMGVRGKRLKSAVAPTRSAGDGVYLCGAGGFGSGTCPTDEQGQCRFFGTSASAPSATGVATLIAEEYRDRLSPVELSKIMKQRAKEREGAAFGAGVLRAALRR